MGGSVGGLFGGDDDEPSSSQTTSSAPWEAVQPYLKDLFAKGQSAQQKMASSKMPEKLSAGFTPAQLQAQQAQLDLSEILGPQMANSMTALNQGFNAMNLENNPYFAGAVQAAINPMVRNFERQTMPRISLNSLANSGYGSSRQGIAEGIAMSDLNQQIGEVSSSMANDAYQKGQDTMVRSLALAPTTYQSMLLPSAIQENVGSQQQAMEQQFLNDALTKWNFNRSKEMDSLMQYAQLLQGNFGGTSTTNATQDSGGGDNTLGKLVGLGTSIAGLF